MDTQTKRRVAIANKFHIGDRVKLRNHHGLIRIGTVRELFPKRVSVTWDNEEFAPNRYHYKPGALEPTIRKRDIHA